MGPERLNIIEVYPKTLQVDFPLLTNLKHIPRYLLNPIRLVQSYDRHHFRPDLIAGLTVAVILLPQAIAFALVA
ncbi:MAG: hypothetical protein GTO60_18965, partial [Gammaproteobacteria bacterium]|nr:hypothetical protein [Gammaproteobacteria bacterium]NIO63959.1 hypothetical protein [Gammaproteobacteria bacterium]